MTIKKWHNLAGAIYGQKSVGAYMNGIAGDLLAWVVLLIFGAGWYFARKGRLIREARERRAAQDLSSANDIGKRFGKMARVVRFKDDTRNCWAVVELENGDPIWISIAQSGVVVKKSKLGLLGPKLYEATVIYNAAMTAKALAILYSAPGLPDGLINPVLRAFTNAVSLCSSAAEVTHRLNEAVHSVEARFGKPVSDVSFEPQ